MKMTQQGSTSHPATRLGILGGGQLARMLAQSAMRQGMRTVVLARSAHEPAALDGVELVTGALDDEAALSALFSRSDCVTIENEFLDLERIGAVMARHPRVRFRPTPCEIARVQDKLEQKQVFARLGVAAADYEPVRVASLDADLGRARARFPDGFVLKWSRFGYDGRGNLVVRPAADPGWQPLERFCRAGEEAGATLYAERLIDFASELAMVSTRADDGTQVFFPLVVSRQQAGICREVFGPASDFGVAPRLEREAVEVLGAIGSELDWCGSFAVEFFLCADGRLLANEIAPRVHNTGHYTLFGDEPSQFDLHVEAVSGRALSQPAVGGCFAMRNLLGPPSVAPERPCPAPAEPPPEGTELVWYDKRVVSPGRKMGHLTGRAASVAQTPALLHAMREYEQRFWMALTDDRQ